MVITDKSCDYCFALCVVLLITFQFWYGTPHISFREFSDSEQMLKSHLYFGSSSIPAGWTIYMCGKEKSNHMSYNVSVVENSRVWTRTVFGNASRMPIPTINKSPSGGIVSYVLSKPQMESLENDPEIEQVYVEPSMHCLEPVKSCSKSAKRRRLVTNDVQCLAIANPNNYEVKVEFMVNFYVSNNDFDNNDIFEISDNELNNKNDINNNINNSASINDDNVTIEESKQQQEGQQEVGQKTNHGTRKPQIIIDVAYSIFSITLKSSV